MTSWSEDVRASLSRLEPLQARVLQKIYFERRTQAQVAAELKMTRRAVARSVASGLQGLSVLIAAAER